MINSRCLRFVFSLFLIFSTSVFSQGNITRAIHEIDDHCINCNTVSDYNIFLLKYVDSCDQKVNSGYTTFKEKINIRISTTKDSLDLERLNNTKQGFDEVYQNWKIHLNKSAKFMSSMIEQGTMSGYHYSVIYISNCIGFIDLVNYYTSNF